MTKALFAALALLFAAPLPAAAATLTVEGGKLTGATGVIVNGDTYDVSFLDGTCAQVFGGCEDSKFAFHDSMSALAAGNSLLAQVFIDGPDGNFDTAPGLTNGCSSMTSCSSLVPFATSGFETAAAYPFNSNIESGDQVFPSIGNNNSFSTTNSANLTWAVFRTSDVTSPVPEPSNWAMMVAGFGLVGSVMRRRICGERPHCGPRGSGGSSAEALAAVDVPVVSLCSTVPQEILRILGGNLWRRQSRC